MQKRYTTVLSISVATLFLMGMSAVQAALSWPLWMQARAGTHA
jgi:hypothetical protein